jgi:hypothetical protein
MTDLMTWLRHWRRWASAGSGGHTSACLKMVSVESRAEGEDLLVGAPFSATAFWKKKEPEKKEREVASGAHPRSMEPGARSRPKHATQSSTGPTGAHAETPRRTGGLVAVFSRRAVAVSCDTVRRSTRASNFTSLHCEICVWLASLGCVCLTFLFYGDYSLGPPRRFSTLFYITLT